MSGLTDEERKRIEENRARALAKLAEKKSKSNIQCCSRVPADKVAGLSRYSTSKEPSSYQNQRQSFSPTKPNTNFCSRSNSSSLHYGVAMNGHSLQKHNFKQATHISDQNSSAINCWKQTKDVNSMLGKRKCVTSGTCVLLDRSRFKVVVGFHSKLIGILRTLPSRCYDSKTQTWNFLLEDYQKLMLLCKPLASEVALSGLPSGILNLFVSRKENTMNDLALKTEIHWEVIDKKLVDSLMAFQKEGIIFSIQQNGRILLADDMGLGKTIQAIAVACYYRKSWPLLVVVPSSLRLTWKQALTRWLPSLDPDLVNVVFTGKDEPNTGLVNIISYDLVVKHISSIKKFGYKVIILDECHSIKNYKTERTKAILPLLKASAHVILMSGTPALSRPAELYTQISAINPRLFPSYHEYGVRYCDGVKNNFGWDYSGSSNMEELQLILEECIMIRRLKKVVMDQLPSKTREVVFLDPSLIKEKTIAKSETMLANAQLKDRRAALLVYFNETCSAKAAAVREYVLDLVEGGHKLIVFAHHQEMLDVISQALLKKKVDYIRIDGKTPSEKRQHLCDQFQRDWATRVAVLSVTAANTGLTLTEATCVVFAELFWNPGALVQAEDRAYRIGQKNSVVIHYLIARKTADDYLWPLIQKKLDVLCEAGLNKESFSNLDTKTFQDPKQRDLKVMFESLVEDLREEDRVVEYNGVTWGSENTAENDKQRQSAAHLNKRNDKNCNERDGMPSLCEKSKVDAVDGSSSGQERKEDWFDELVNDDWGEFFVDIDEPSAKRKRT